MTLHESSPGDLHFLAGRDAPVPRVQRRTAEERTDRQESDAAYFARRAAEERAFARTLPDAHAQALHLEIADRYGQLAAAIQEADDRVG